MRSTGEAPRGASLPMRYVFLVVVFFVISYLLRFVLILIAAQSLQGSGVPAEEATQRAITLYLQDPQTVMTVTAFQGLAWLPIVWLVVVLLERGSFRWADFGLEWRRDSPRALLFGVLLAVGACLAYLVVGALLQRGTPLGTDALAKTTLGAASVACAMFLVNAFGEELAFRGWLQARLLDRNSPIVAAALGSVLFVPLHLLTQQVEAAALASGLLLWFAIGALYYLTRSLYLVGALHTLLNALPAILQVQVAPEAGLIVHAAAAGLAAWVLYRQPGMERRSTPSPAR